MDFTREPIIESVITPKEGCKLVIRSSKGSGQEEFFVDAVEVVSFGNTFFLRSLERPKSFLVPASDYEILEVRETRMVLKNVGIDQSIKIGGGREPKKSEPKPTPAPAPKLPTEKPPVPEAKLEKKRERRRSYRRRRGREDADVEGEDVAAIPIEGSQSENEVQAPPTPAIFIPPPPTLISESIARYKENQLFKDVFFPKEEETATETTQELGILEETFHIPPVSDTSDDPFSLPPEEVPLEGLSDKE